MRINYKTYPTDYIMELKRAGNRKKAMAFFDYYSDMEEKNANSFGFYAKAWSVSKSTSHKWIDEFKREVDLFLSGWWLRNNTHYNYAKNVGERLPNDLPHSKVPEHGSLGEEGERLANEVFNINDDDMHRDKFFADLFWIYRVNYKYAGKKENAYKEYVKVHNSISYEELKRAIILYLHDNSISKKYNFANFLKNQVYLAYIAKTIKVLIDGRWEAGEYDDKTELFKFGNEQAILSSQRLGELYKDGKLEFIKRGA